MPLKSTNRDGTKLSVFRVHVCVSYRVKCMKLDLYYFDDHITNNIVILTEGISNLSKDFEKIILLVSCIFETI